MAYGKKQFKNDPYAKCDECGKRIYDEKDRIYKWGWFHVFEDWRIATGVYCAECDMKALHSLIESLGGVKENGINANWTNG